jgi:NADH dehydrogenase [ubiquinone] 1 alpha subcomplex assembly factor 7
VTPAISGDAVAHELRRRIAADGRVTIAAFMELALGGYYADRDPLGARGDFITAPEVSQMFGEMIGLWCVDLWSRSGKPNPFILAELGPGRGTLMADALRAARVAPDFLTAAEIHLVEINATLIAAQKAALPSCFKPQWHKGFDTLPPGPMLLIANEFWDALPIHQFVMTGSGWKERVIISTDENSFAFGEADPGPELALLRPEHIAATLGEVAEVSPAGLRVAAALGRRFARSPGAALIIDYGPMQSGLGDSLQALKQHRHHDPLIDPGSADLTAHVDFAALAAAACNAGAAAHGPATQAEFLQTLGIVLRAETLKAKSNATQRTEIDAALERLIGGLGMGSLFKVLALTAPSTPPPAGLSPSEHD